MRSDYTGKAAALGLLPWQRSDLRPAAGASMRAGGRPSGAVCGPNRGSSLITTSRVGRWLARGRRNHGGAGAAELAERSAPRPGYRGSRAAGFSRQPLQPSLCEDLVLRAGGRRSLRSRLRPARRIALQEWRVLAGRIAGICPAGRFRKGAGADHRGEPAPASQRTVSSVTNLLPEHAADSCASPWKRPRGPIGRVDEDHPSHMPTSFAKVRER